MYRRCWSTRDSPAGPSDLRPLTYAMAAMPRALIPPLPAIVFAATVRFLFGQTEISPVTTLFRPRHQLAHLAPVARQLTPVTNVPVRCMGRRHLLPDG